jgi:uncharacterized repeat protein (TIGR01451 family)
MTAAWLLLIVSVGWSADWPTDGGSLRRTGDAPDARVVPPFVLKWTFDMKAQGCVNPAGASPIVVGSTVYQGTRGGLCGWVYALDARRGTLLWTYVSGYDTMTTPSYENGCLYLGLGMSGPFAGRAIRVEDRAELWTYGTSCDFVTVTPHGETAYVQGGSDGVGSATLYAVDSTTGALRWSMTDAPPMHLGGTPAFDNDGTLVTPGWPLLAIADLGKAPHVKWSVTYVGCPCGRPDPAISGDRVYFRQGAVPHAIIAVDMTNGAVAWTLTVGGGIGPCSVHAKRIVFNTIDDTSATASGYVYAVEDLGDHPSVVWTTNTLDSSVLTRRPLIANGMVYLTGTVNGDVLYALDLNTGDIVWTHTLSANSISSVAYANGLLYCAGATEVQCFGKPISLGLEVDKAQGNPGDLLIYTLTFDSYGGPSASVTLTETLPAGLQFVSASDGGSLSGSVLAWNGLSVSADAVRTVTATVRVRSDLTPGTYTFRPTAFVTYPGDPAYNDMTSDPAVTTVTVTAAPPPVYTGPLRVYPNPFIPARAVRGTVKFEGLSTGATVGLYTPRGLKVWAKGLVTGSVVEWDGRNEAGRLVASGMYVWVVEGGGKTSRGKLVVETGR